MRPIPRRRFFSDLETEKFAKRLGGRTDVEDALQRLDKLTREETRTIVAKNLEVAHSIKESAQSLLKYPYLSLMTLPNSCGEAKSFVTPQFSSISHFNGAHLDNQSRDRLKSWLSPPNPSINHNTACGAHHDGTGTWFIHGNSFEAWKASGSLLWVHGKRTPIFYVYSLIAADTLPGFQPVLARAFLRTFF